MKNTPIREEERSSTMNPSDCNRLLALCQELDKVIEEAEIKLKSDDLYFFYTDGASDAMNSDQEEFGEENLRKSLIKHYHLNCEEMKANLINDIWNHIGKQDVHDDITMIILKIK